MMGGGYSSSSEIGALTALAEGDAVLAEQLISQLSPPELNTFCIVLKVALSLAQSRQLVLRARDCT